jgi:hypothetical protein
MNARNGQLLATRRSIEGLPTARPLAIFVDLVQPVAPSITIVLPGVTVRGQLFNLGGTRRDTSTREVGRAHALAHATRIIDVH